MTVTNPSNRIAVALALDDTQATLGALQELRHLIGMAEIRLDCMQEFDLQRLVEHSPCPLIMTCRPPREGGRFSGSEEERLEILSRATALECRYVDVEWDSINRFRNRGSSTRVIVSRHYFDTVPADIWQQYQQMREHAYAVKLVGFARRASEALPLLELVAGADSPVIAIAMGEAGIVTRLVAPCFDACLLTYGSAGSGSGTAPGQLDVREMVDRYAIDRVSNQTRIKVNLYTSPESGADTAAGGDGQSLRVSVPVDADEFEAVARAYRKLSPRISTSPSGQRPGRSAS